MKIYKAKIQVWTGREFLVLDFPMADNGQSLGSVIREYVSAMECRLIYWCRV
ncbi:MAG: hypothetical protein HC851_25020 [Acaryochloris sp. RU_4_1]|nr:hypothetical protein [Acaryochloris sp. RU_4_1]NJR56530.1 hypothetical protein [Acaryochloris sp. CRU_2_0]